MKDTQCKDCSFLEYHNGVAYCGGYEFLTDKAKIENQEECEYAESEE